MNLQEKADALIDNTIELLKIEGYTKGHYGPQTEEAKFDMADGIRQQDGRKPTACGTRYCAIGALEAADNGKGLVTPWSTLRHGLQRLNRHYRHAIPSPALMRAYAAINVAALTLDIDPGDADNPAEAYSESPRTKRADVIRLMRKAKRLTGRTTPSLKNEWESTLNG